MNDYDPKFPPWFPKEEQARVVRNYLDNGYDELRIRRIMTFTEEEYHELVAMTDVD